MSAHRQVKIAYPDAPLGTCRYCGQPCRVGMRSHPDCAAEHREMRDYRGTALAEHGEVCARCSTTRGPFEADHEVPLWRGGSKRKSNVQVLCQPCHKRKTAREAAERARLRKRTAVTVADRAWVRPVLGLGLVGYAAASLLGHPGLGLPAVLLPIVGAVAYWLRQDRDVARGKAEARLREIVADAFGLAATYPGLLVVERWSGMVAERFTVQYGTGFRDGDSEERRRVGVLLERKAGREYAAQWRPAEDEVTFTAGQASVESEPEPDVTVDVHEEETRRVTEAVQGFVKGPAVVTVEEADRLGLKALAVAYPSTFRDDSPDTRYGLQAVVNAKTREGRWRLDWDTAQDRVRAVRRPPMPALIAHPEPLDTDDPWRLPFATDEDGAQVAWDLRRAPHCLLAGETGSGKTVTLRALITEAAVRGFQVRIADPKRIELSGFREWPCVAEVATSTEDMVDLVERMYDLMDSRYADVEAKRKRVDDLRPVLFVVDEAREFIDRANAHWKATKERGQAGSTHPVIEQWRSIARLGRSARVHLLTGIQRPDAAIFGGEARDQYGARISMGPMSPQGAMMMYGDQSIGRDLPAEAKGRATADVDARGAREVQTWYTPDPAAEDPSEADMDVLRYLAP